MEAVGRMRGKGNGPKAVLVDMYPKFRNAYIIVFQCLTYFLHGISVFPYVHFKRFIQCLQFYSMC